MSMSLVWLFSFLGLLVLGMPIAIAIGLGAAVAVVVSEGTSALLVPTMLYTSMDSFVLSAVPLFIATGVIMERSGLAERLFGFADSLVGWTRGGMGHASVVASLVFGGISGSAVSDSAALGPLEVQLMEKSGYRKAVAAALAAAGSTLAAIMPPSVIMVIYAVSAGVSAAKMLVAGIVPGILVGASLMLVNGIIARYYELRPSSKFVLRRVVGETRQAVWALLAPIIILGGLLTGTFTPTEAGCVAAIYTFLVARYVYRTVSYSEIPSLLIEIGRTSGVALAILATASIGAHILAVERVPQEVASWAGMLGNDPLIIWPVLIGLFILVGMFLEGLAAIIILTPVLLPLVYSLGIDPIHFGVVFVMSLCIGLVTPPVGICLFVVSQVTGVGMEKLIFYSIPYVAMLLVTVLALAFFPELSMYLTRYI